MRVRQLGIVNMVISPTVFAFQNKTNVNNTIGEHEYDATGAAMFTIVVILTYTLSIICLIASLSFRKRKLIEDDQAATNYLKYIREVPRVESQVGVYFTDVYDSLLIYVTGNASK